MNNLILDLGREGHILEDIKINKLLLTNNLKTCLIALLNLKNLENCWKKGSKFIKIYQI